MAILTQAEKEFLDVFLHEATTSPFFSGSATKALYAIGVEYHDISYIAWAYEQDVPRTSLELGHTAEVAPPLPWSTRESALQRNKEIQGVRNQNQERGGLGELRRSDQRNSKHPPTAGGRAVLERLDVNLLQEIETTPQRSGFEGGNGTHNTAG